MFFPDSVPALPARFPLTPEFRLLVACSAAQRASRENPSTSTIASLCGSKINWDAFVTLVDRHLMHGPTYAALCEHGADCFPDHIKQRLKRRKLQVCGEALRHAAELARLNRAFAGHAIDVISLKGVALSLRLFGDVAMRHVRDIDLMVKPEELGRSDELLKACGYKCTFPDFKLTPKTEKKMLSQDHDRTYVHEQLHMMVELHWRIDRWTAESISELWQNSTKMDRLGTTTRELDDAALLLYLCSHGAGHKWGCLKWLNDVAALLQQKSLASDCRSTWSGILEMAARFDLKRALAQTALLLHWLYGTSLPQALRQLIKTDPLAINLACQALQVMLMDEQHLHASEHLGQWKYLRYTVQLRRHLPFHVHLGQVLISSSYFNEFSIPDRLFWLHYPLRPLIWLTRRYRELR
jgi:Uncharacterised nucleotidyltransferase